MWMNARLLLFFSLLLFTSIEGHASDHRGERSAPRILVLNSFHPGHPWGDDFVDALKSELRRGENHVEFYIEYMDADRHHDVAYLQHLFNIYHYRYLHVPLDGIVAFGDGALDFLRRHHLQLFDGTPVVFAGVSDIGDGRLAGYEDFTGVKIEVDAGPTIELIRTLHPGARRLVVITDDTAAGRVLHKAIVDRDRTGAQLKIETLDGSRLTTKQTLEKVRLLGPADALLFTSWSKNKNGTFFSSRASLSQVVEKSPMPVYGLLDSHLGYGIAGGYLYSARDLGAQASSIMDRVLEGDDPASLANETVTKGHFRFDARQLERFGIEERLLPEGASVVGREVSFYERYKTQIWLGLGVLLAQALTIAFLGTTIIRRKRAERALRRSEQTLDLAIRGADLGLWSWHLTSSKLKLSDRWVEILGYRPGEIPCELAAWHNLIHPDDRPGFITAIDAHVAGVTPFFRAEHRMVAKDGSTRWVITSGKVIRRDANKADDAPQKMTGTHLDITEQRTAEHQSTVLEEQLLQRQKIESIGELAGGIAHDMNNLLSPILGFSDLVLSEMDPDDPHYEDLHNIRTAARRARNLVSKLLAFGRKQVLSPRRLDLNKAAAELESMLRPLTREDVEIELDLEPRLNLICADPTQVQQILVNLVVNATDAMPDGGRLYIRTRNARFLPQDLAGTVCDTERGYVVLSVQDTGIGMTGDVKERIFEPFFTTKQKAHGTGLGLATVFGIVQQHGAHIRVVTDLGKGTQFDVFFPRVARGGHKDSTPPPRSETVFGTETILVAEDDANVRKLVVEVLRKQGYRVLEAGDGCEALEIAQAFDGEIHLVLTDVIMPNINGRQLERKLARRRPGIAVAYMSGYTDDVIAHQGVIDENTRLLNKPFVVHDLLRFVQDALGGKQLPSQVG